MGIFHWHDPSGRTMALVSTQPLTEMSTRYISWGVKVASALGWQHYHLHVLTVLKSGSLNLLEPSGPIQACNWITLCMSLTSHTWVASSMVSQLHTSATFMIQVFWGVMPCSVVNSYWYFKGLFYLHIQDAAVQGLFFSTVPWLVKCYNYN